jgi:hypothetical protein
MRNNFLSVPGRWLATGICWDGQGREHPTTGENTVSHESGVWISSGIMRVHSEPPIEFENRYEIQPLRSGELSTTWTSENPVLGMLKGTFTFLENVLLSVYYAADRSFHGSECLELLDDNTCNVTGVFLHGSRRLSSWRIQLNRVVD